MKLDARRGLLSPLVLAVPLISAAAGCASIQPDIDASRRHPEQIHWPEPYDPDEATFFLHNEIEIAASPEAVWNVLIQAETWPDWYEGARDVEVQNDSGVLEMGTVFTWKTMGLEFTSTVTQFEPYSRLSWESNKRSINGLHGWLLIPTEIGCLLITDESQHGWMSRLERAFQPHKLRRLHDVWLAEIKTKAEAA